MDASRESGAGQPVLSGTPWRPGRPPGSAGVYLELDLYVVASGGLIVGKQGVTVGPELQPAVLVEEDSVAVPLVGGAPNRRPVFILRTLRWDSFLFREELGWLS